MKVLLTGAAGFVGSHTARALLDRGHDVLALVRSSGSSRLTDLSERISIIIGDLGDAALLRRITDCRPEACIHLAWYAVPGKYLTAPENTASLSDSLTLLQHLLAVGCRRFVMAGTCAEYAQSPDLLHENSPTATQTIYAACKLSLCQIGQHLARDAKADFAWARLFSMYGPDEASGRLIPALIRSLLRQEPFAATAGVQMRDYLHVEDVASALVAMLDHSANGIFNVASGQPLAVRRLMELVADHVGHRDLVRFGAIPDRAWEPAFIGGDNQRLRALSWQPHHSLETGLAQTVNWWVERLRGKLHG